MSCTTPADQPACGCNQPGCQKCQPPCLPPAPPCPPPTYPQPPVQPLSYQPQETGQYVAPPLAGSTVGASGRVGVDTGGIVFPELRLRFPRIEMPGMFRSRSQARMDYEAGSAPWQATGVVNAASAQNEVVLAAQVAQLQQQLAAQQPASAPSQAEALAAKEAAEKYLAASQAELERLRCEVNRLRALEECLKQAHERALANPDCRTPAGQPTSGPAPTPATPLQAPPVPYPTPAPDKTGARTIYPAQPAAYQGELVAAPPPAPLTAIIRQPSLAPRDQTIREPQARILGVRLR